MATNNAVNTTLSGQSGTGSFAGTTSPTFVTPTLGAALATSINFGGSSLANYITLTSFTPTFTFATPGDLSVAYAVQNGQYIRIGSMVWFSISIRFTPTFTTASGIALFAGLPLTPSTTASYVFSAIIFESTTFPVGATEIVGLQSSSSANVKLSGSGTATAATDLTATNFPTSTQKTVTINGIFSV